MIALFDEHGLQREKQDVVTFFDEYLGLGTDARFELRGRSDRDFNRKALDFLAAALLAPESDGGNPTDAAFEYHAGVGVHGDGHLLAFFDLRDVGLVDQRLHLHDSEIWNCEQGLSSMHALSEPGTTLPGATGITVDHDARARRRDRELLDPLFDAHEVLRQAVESALSRLDLDLGLP